MGRPTKYHEKIYNIVLASQIATIKEISVGEYGDKLDFAARHVINLAGFGKYFTHATGHGVGRKIHEQPVLRPSSGDVLALNDVVTVEPGIYLPGKFGVRIEDMVLVDKTPRVFSNIPKDFKSMVVKTSN